jgi:hypothetical protein
MMKSYVRLLCASVAAVLIAPSAWATIDVGFDPIFSNVNLADLTVSIDLVADIPAGDAIIGWGLDLFTVGTSAALSSIEINEAVFDASAGLDGDGLVALVEPLQTPLSGDDIVLATLHFDLLAEGLTTLTLADDGLTDVTEGFFLGVGGNAEVSYGTGTINVIPEPSAFALAALILIWRRR